MQETTLVLLPPSSFLSQKSPRELLQTVVARFFRMGEEPPHVRKELRVAPPISCRVLGSAGIAGARGLEDDAGCDGVEGRIVAGRQVEVATGSGPRVLVHECA